MSCHHMWFKNTCKRYILYITFVLNYYLQTHRANIPVTVQVKRNSTLKTHIYRLTTYNSFTKLIVWITYICSLRTEITSLHVEPLWTSTPSLQYDSATTGFKTNNCPNSNEKIRHNEIKLVITNNLFFFG